MLKQLTVQQLLQWLVDAQAKQESSWNEQYAIYMLKRDDCIQQTAPNKQVNDALGLLVWSLWEHSINDCHDFLAAIEQSK